MSWSLVRYVALHYRTLSKEVLCGMPHTPEWVEPSYFFKIKLNFMYKWKRWNHNFRMWMRYKCCNTCFCSCLVPVSLSHNSVCVCLTAQTYYWKQAFCTVQQQVRSRHDGGDSYDRRPKLGRPQGEDISSLSEAAATGVAWRRCRRRVGSKSGCLRACLL